MKGLDLVIFDCDGVIADSEVLACQALADVLADHGLPLGLAGVFDAFLGRGFAAVESYYRETTGEPLPAALREALAARIADLYRSSLQPVSGIAAVLRTLELPFCLASSSEPWRIALTLRAVALADQFGTRVYSASQVQRGKPAPDLFLFAAERMGVDPVRCLVIEDTVPGVEAGKAAGMTVWGFVGGSHCVGRDVGRKLRAAGADRVFDRMSAFFED
jgi:HAD superfamily hydrolase (TIGR01509 family)